jgi:prepilin-type N-terminal cleavage/methylation domain-containing protein
MLQGGGKTACSKGFTLAEVLITLGIIGVVAALTIPTLINKCQKIVLAKQAQETHAILTQAFKRILADNNTTSLTETEVWDKIESAENYVNGFDPQDQYTPFWTEMGKYIKLSNSKTINTDSYCYTDDCSGKDSYWDYPIYFPSGAKLTSYEFYKIDYSKDEECKKIKALGGNMCSVVGEFDIDINGEKGPNKRGRDIYTYGLSNDGALYLYGGKDTALYHNQTDLASNPNYWKNIYNGTKEQNAKKNGSFRGGQLMEEGWKMNY